MLASLARAGNLRPGLLIGFAAETQDVVAYAASVMDVYPPPEIDFETAALSPMARSFYGENKRVSNAAIKALGFAFRYRDYRAAFDAMWSDGSWR